jgi:hypothetical protein
LLPEEDGDRVLPGGGGDFLAIYVVRKDAWFVLPAKVVLRLKSNIRVAPGNVKQKYAQYEGAWELLRRHKKAAGGRGGLKTGVDRTLARFRETVKI